MPQKHNPHHEHHESNVTVGYAYATPYGTTNTVAQTTVKVAGNETVAFQPSSAPAGTTGYQPQVTNSSGQTVAYNTYEHGTTFELDGVPVDKVPYDPATFDPSTLDPADPDSLSDPPNEGDPSTSQDDSGIDAPDSELSDMVGLGPTLPVPGTYKVRLTKFTVDPDDEKEDETAPGPEATLEVTTAHYLRVKPPRDYQNWLSNPQVAARKNDAARTPEGWERNEVENVSVLDTIPGVQTVEDTSMSTDDHEVIVTPPVLVFLYLDAITGLLAFPTLTTRAIVDLPEFAYDGGAVQIAIRETLTNATTLDTIIHTADSADIHDVVIRMADETTDPPFEYFAFNPSIESFQMVFTLIGSDLDAGARSLVANIQNAGVVLGEAIPPKRIEELDRPVVPQTIMESFFPNLNPLFPINAPPAEPWVPVPGIPGLLPPGLGFGDLFPPAIPPVTSPPVEPPAAPYPTFGYSTVVINPPTSQRAIMTPAGLDPPVYVPGNMVEYYGPKGMPVTSTFFLGGMKAPVKQEERRVFSFYFFWRGVTQPATPLKAVLKNKAHVVIQDLGTFEGLSGVTGDSSNEPDADENGYVRRPLYVTVPLGNPLLTNPLDDLEHGGAYIEIIPGGIGDGLFRIMGGQNEMGETMTAFSIEHAPTGSLISTFDMGVPGVPQDALPTLAKVKWYVDMDAEVTDAVVNGVVKSSYLVEAQVKRYEAESYSSWTTDLDALEVPSEAGYNLRLRTTLNTTDLDVTPEMSAHFIDFERESQGGMGFGTLCRVDGTEFDGTVTLYDFPPARDQKPIVQEEYADHTRGFGVMGNSTKWARGFGIECYLNSTAEEIMSLIGEVSNLDSDTFDDDDASVFLAEIFDTRYRLRILDMDIQPVNREGHIPLTGMEADGYWLLQAESIEGEILSQEIF